MAFSEQKCYSQAKGDDDFSNEVDIRIPQQRIEHHLQVSNKRIFEGKLTQLVEELGGCTEVTEDFIYGFPEWHAYRGRSIACLDSVVKALDTIHNNVNIAKAVASTGGLVSSCIGVGAAGAMLADDPICTPLRVVAGVGNVTTSLIGAGAAATEIALSEKELKKVKKTLMEDSERFEIVLMFFERSSDVTGAIESVCNISVISDVFQELVAIVPKVRSTSSILSYQVTEVMKAVVKMLGKGMSNIDIDRIILLCVSVCQNPELLANMKDILRVLTDVPSLIPMLKMVSIVFSEGKFLAEHMYNASKQPVGNSGTSTEGAVMYGLFQAVNIAVELFSLSVLLQDFLKGSKSQYSPQIQRVSEMLKAESALISHLYKRVKEGKE